MPAPVRCSSAIVASRKLFNVAFTSGVWPHGAKVSPGTRSMKNSIRPENKETHGVFGTLAESSALRIESILFREDVARSCSLKVEFETRPE